MNTAVYIIGQIEVKDFKVYFPEYAQKFKPILDAFDAEVLVSTQECEILEGERYGNWSVVIKFPTKEKALACINSDAYKPLANLRINELTTGGNVTMFPAYMSTWLK